MPPPVHCIAHVRGHVYELDVAGDWPFQHTIAEQGFKFVPVGDAPRLPETEMVTLEVEDLSEAGPPILREWVGDTPPGEPGR